MDKPSKDLLLLRSLVHLIHKSHMMYSTHLYIYLVRLLIVKSIATLLPLKIVKLIQRHSSGIQ